MEQIEPRLTLNTDTLLGRSNKAMAETNPSRFLSLAHMILLHRDICHYHPDLNQVLHFNDTDYIPMLVWSPAAATPRNKQGPESNHYVLEVVAPFLQFDDFPNRDDATEYFVCLSYEDSDRVIQQRTTRNRADTVKAIRDFMAHVHHLQRQGKAEWQRRHNQKHRQRQRLSRQARQQPQ